MHIEPGMLAPAKIAVANVVAAGMLLAHAPPRWARAGFDERLTTAS